MPLAGPTAHGHKAIGYGLRVKAIAFTLKALPFQIKEKTNLKFW